MPGKLFKDCVFVSLPKSVASSVTKFKKQIYIKNGAAVKPSVTVKDISSVTHILVDYEKLNTKHSILSSINCNRTFVEKFDENKNAFRAYIEQLQQIPFIKEEWVNSCIERRKLLSYKSYAISMAREIDEEYKSIINSYDNGLSRKRAINVSDTDDDEQSSSAYISKHRQKRQKQESQPQPQQKKISEISEKIRSPGWIETVLNRKLLGPESLKSNPNLPVITALNELRNEYNALGDDYRVKGYDAATNALLLSVDAFITTAKAASKLQGIGPSIASKIEEFYQTGKIKVIEEIRSNPDLQILKTLNKIYGVGPKISKDWFEKKNIKGIEDVIANEAELKLNDSQKWGLKYFDDWQKHIPRNVSKMHFSFITNICKQLDPEIEVYIMGSFRRGLRYSHDIDFIITRPGYSKNKLRDSRISLIIISTLQEKQYMKCILSASTLKYLTGATLIDAAELDEEFKKDPDFVAEQTICRRVDFLFVPWDELGAALMYFTGNNIFNRLTRQLAASKGFNLSNHGLFEKNYALLGSNPSSKQKGYGKRRRQDEQQESFNDSDVEDSSDEAKKKFLIESFDEKKIFGKIGVVWHEPEERNIGEYLRL